MSGQIQRPQGAYSAGVPWPRYGQQQSAQSQYSQPQSNQQYGQYQYAQQQQPQQQYSQQQYAQQPQQPQQQYTQQSPAQYPDTQQPNAQPGYAHQQVGQAQYPTQQAPSSAPWSQQYGAQQSNGYPGYPGQSYPTANTYSQQAQYAQPAPPATAYSQTPPAIASGNNSGNTCYNCGSPGHWAQNCPEPRRQTPAGASGHNGPPAKRFRPNYIPPVVTKYEVPDHIKQAHMARVNGGVFQSTPQSATPASQFIPPSPAVPFQQSYGNSMPPTPISATSPGYAQSQPWSAQVSPPPPGMHASSQTPSTPYTPQASPHSSTYSNAVAPPPAALPPPPPAESPLGKVHGVPKGTNGFSKKWQGGAHKKQHPRNRTDRNDTDAVAIKPTLRTELTKHFDQASIADKTVSDSAAEESITEDDLSLLDIPDMPTEDPAKYGHLACHLISAPLQTFSATDLPDLIPHPAKDSDGTVSSRWIRPSTLSVTMQSVRQRDNFHQKSEDPIFLFQVGDDTPKAAEVPNEKPPSPATPPVRAYGRENKPPPPTAAPVHPYRTDNSRPRPPQDIQYKTVSNGPVAEIPRASTPIPQADPDAINSDEYDPFNPSAGLPDMTVESSKEEAATEDDPWNPAATSDPAWGGVSYSPPRASVVQGNGAQHLERKRSYANTFDDNHDAGRKKIHSFPRRKRGNAADSHSRRW